MKGLRAGRRLAVLVACLTLLASCTDTGVEGDPAPPTTPPATERADASTPVAQLRLTLEAQFALFAFAGAEALRVPKPDENAAQALVDDSAEDVVDTIRSIDDEAEAEDLAGHLEAWHDVTAEYATAGKRDRDRLERRMETVAADIAEFITEATGESMESDGTAALLRGPLRRTATSGQSFADKDYETSYIRARTAYADMVSVGEAFAAGISENDPDRFTGQRRSGRVELASALQQLLGEHVLLTATVTRRGARGARDFDAAAAALNGNSEDVATALDTYYGAAATPVTTIWRDRISVLADYTVAAVEERDGRMDKHRAELQRLDERLGRRLEDVTEETISPDAATQDARQMTTVLLDQIDAYVSKDAAGANKALRRAYSAAGDFAALLAAGIADHRPQDFQ